MTLKAVKAHTWLYPHRALFRTPISDFEAQAKESISHLSATPMGRSVSARESHTSYISPSSSHLVSHIAKDVSPPSSPEISSVMLDPRRHTVQLEYDRPLPAITRVDTSKADKKIIMEDTGPKTSKNDRDISGLGVPPAPALVRSATTGASTTARPVTLDTVDERSPEKTRQGERRPSPSSSTSGVSKPPTARPTMPHGSKPRPTSYHPPSSGGIPMSKGRSASGDRTATLLVQRQSSSASSKKAFNEPSPSAPMSSYKNVEGEIVQSSTPPQETLVVRAKPSPQPVVEQPIGPPPQRSRTHKRASASISMVADRVFGFFTTAKPVSPASSPKRQGSVIGNTARSKEVLGRSNTTTRKTPILGSPAGATILAKKREKSYSSKSSIIRSATEHAISSSPKAPSASAQPRSASQAAPATEGTKIVLGRAESQIPALPSLDAVAPTRRRTESNPRLRQPSKKLGELGPEKASSGPARRVMEFFRRRARIFSD